MPGRKDFALRPMTETDLELVLTWRNSQRIRDISYSDHIISTAEHRAWFAHAEKEQKSLHFIFEYCRRPIGVVNVTAIDHDNKTCYWGFYLGETDLPKGCGSAMGFLALENIYETLGMDKVTGEAFAFNNESIAFHKRLGFVEERRRGGVKNGRNEDIVVMRLSRADWLRIKPELERKFFGQSGVPCLK